MTNASPAISVRSLRRDFVSGHRFSSHRPLVRAVDDISFDVAAGSTFGIVGESGSGKSTTARLLCGLDRMDAGTVHVDGIDIAGIRSRAGLLRFRRSLQMVFQDPYAALNPNWKIGRLVTEGMNVHNLHPVDERPLRAVRLLEQCGLSADAMTRYPHEFSGGQRQRICIARALAVEPRILVLDEPVSALDVSIQAQVLLLLQDLQRSLGLTYVLISHNLAVVEQMCDALAVMKAGKIVETGPCAQVIGAPQHPYTAELIAATPKVTFGEEDNTITPTGSIK
jgi:ABC-type glutathione transport system ATPase component